VVKKVEVGLKESPSALTNNKTGEEHPLPLASFSVKGSKKVMFRAMAVILGPSRKCQENMRLQLRAPLSLSC
jgi:hypothetical protein